MDAEAMAAESVSADRERKVIVLKPMHLGLAMAVHLIVIIFTIGLFYGTMRTQIDDDRATIQLLIKSNDELNKNVSNLNSEIARLRGQIDAMVQLKATK